MKNFVADMLSPTAAEMQSSSQVIFSSTQPSQTSESTDNSTDTIGYRVIYLCFVQFISCGNTNLSSAVAEEQRTRFANWHPFNCYAT